MFFAATVRQQATELKKITNILGSQLAVIKDRDRVEDATALHMACEQFSRLLDQLSSVPVGMDIPTAA